MNFFKDKVDGMFIKLVSNLWLELYLKNRTYFCQMFSISVVLAMYWQRFMAIGLLIRSLKELIGELLFTIGITLIMLRIGLLL